MQLFSKERFFQNRGAHPYSNYNNDATETLLKIYWFVLIKEQMMLQVIMIVLRLIDVNENYLHCIVLFPKHDSILSGQLHSLYPPGLINIPNTVVHNTVE